MNTEKSDSVYALGTYESTESGAFTDGPFSTLEEAKGCPGDDKTYILRCVIDGPIKIVCQWKDGAWEDVMHVDLTFKEKKPTLAELQACLDGPDKPIVTLPNGEIRVQDEVLEDAPTSDMRLGLAYLTGGGKGGTAKTVTLGFFDKLHTGAQYRYSRLSMHVEDTLASVADAVIAMGNRLKAHQFDPEDRRMGSGFGPKMPWNLMCDPLRYVELLVELDIMIADGRGDTEEADKLREDMEPHFRNLDADTNDRINALAGKLNEIHDIYEKKIKEARNDRQV